MTATKTVRVPEILYKRAEQLQEERDFSTIGEAIRHMCQEGGFDV